ncbi:hypothetical protein BX600DRAFT_466146 [Xylariales sp. PMI_506]|nr:hypothetical protein BX600DRAFT_466146 [Xylariales sp. PMI_506]
MKLPSRLAIRCVPARPLLAPSPASSLSIAFARQIHSTTTAPASVSPIHGTGPPPEPPSPEQTNAALRLERRRKQAAMLRAAQDIRAAANSRKSGKDSSSSSSSTPQEGFLRRRFWKDVHVKEVDGAWEVHLDARPLRHPNTKEIVRVPLSKPLLAAALAHEWDMLVSAQQATKQHLIPLTSLVCRALDIAEDDAAGSRIRATIVKTVMRYLDTDSLLCWAPPPRLHDAVEGEETLRDRQKRTAEEIVGFLTARVWPGVEIEPVLDGETIMPRGQSPATRQIVEGWVAGLGPWDLAGLERGVLAGKGLLGAVRLLVEWSEGFASTTASEGRTFGVEEAAKAASLEVDWQIGNWGEVEDTHDVEKEDLRRQLGSLVLLVSGTGQKQ